MAKALVPHPSMMADTTLIRYECVATAKRVPIYYFPLSAHSLYEANRTSVLPSLNPRTLSAAFGH